MDAPIIEMEMSLAPWELYEDGSFGLLISDLLPLP